MTSMLTENKPTYTIRPRLWKRHMDWSQRDKVSAIKPTTRYSCVQVKPLHNSKEMHRNLGMPGKIYNTKDIEGQSK
jgi:hypothetical protein